MVGRVEMFKLKKEGSHDKCFVFHFSVLHTMFPCRVHVNSTLLDGDTCFISLPQCFCFLKWHYVVSSERTWIFFIHILLHVWLWGLVILLQMEPVREWGLALGIRQAKQQIATALLTTCFSKRTTGQCSSSTSFSYTVSKNLILCHRSDFVTAFQTPQVCLLELFPQGHKGAQRWGHIQTKWRCSLIVRTVFGSSWP